MVGVQNRPNYFNNFEMAIDNFLNFAERIFPAVNFPIMLTGYLDAAESERNAEKQTQKRHP